jgi:hypothetical protein
VVVGARLDGVLIVGGSNTGMLGGLDLGALNEGLGETGVDKVRLTARFIISSKAAHDKSIFSYLFIFYSDANIS